MQRVGEQISAVAPTKAPVLLLGETGVGKERAASSVHEQSGRRDEQFLVINCGSIPENLIESELFGHVKGSFTGATGERTGLFESASGGTLFLDEIGELPLQLQPRLLRVLETGEVRPVGSSKHIRVNVRLVAATHRDLNQMVEVREFREDLFYRLNVFPISIPPLRQRKDEFWPLVGKFIGEFFDGQVAVSNAVNDLFNSYGWPGNIRELRNVLEYASITCIGSIIAPANLPPNFGADRTRLPYIGPATWQEVDRHMIIESLARNGHRKPDVAAELGYSLKTLYNRMHNYGLEDQIQKQGTSS